MTQNFHSNNRYIAFLVAVLVLTLSATGLRAQCSWGLTATATASTCAANGSITTSLTGADAGSITNILYSLQPLSGGGYSVSPNTSAVFENVPAGQYRAIAEGVCNGAAVSVSYTITVPGNYIPFTAAATQQRLTLNSCSTGQVLVSLANGKLPYSISITAKPSAYTGRTAFTVNGNLTIDSLPKGSYTMVITDACGATAATQTVVIEELPVLPAGDVYTGSLTMIGCNQFIVSVPAFYSNSPFYSTYTNFDTPLKYTIAYNGGAKQPYKQMISSNTDAITLPAGQTFKDSYGKALTFYIQTPCGQETPVSLVLPAPYAPLGYTPHCALNFDATYYIYPDPNLNICLPVYTTIKNNSTNAIWYDTVGVINQSRIIKGLPYGSYTVTITTKDGYQIVNNPNWQVSAPNNANPYTVYKYNNAGAYGNDGAIYFQLNKTTGNFSGGTHVQLLTPSNYIFSEIVSEGYPNDYYFALKPSNGYNFYPGNYTFRITDECGTYDLPVLVEERDVYRYTWSFTEEQTCTGLKITPSGTAMYQDESLPVYFKITQGPGAFDGRIIAEGASLLLPLEGEYKIAIGANGSGVYDYSYPGNDVNMQSATFIYRPLAIDVNHSLGWVCPGLPEDSGNITAVAINGSKAATGVYTYRLAAAGQGATGPFLATNTTGKFSTASSGGTYTLKKNLNYDVRVEDECGAAAVQTIKVIDFATAQVASSDKPQYCLGDEIHFKVINLPTTAIRYEWKDPDGNIFDTTQNPVLKPVTSGTGGNYHVKISADICHQPIEDDITIVLAPYVITCYSAITDTSVNPYAYGLLGNWRPVRSYDYYGLREQSDPAPSATDIRHDGAFNDFSAFWKKQTSRWTSQPVDTTRWVWNSEVTIFNKKGFELENRDAFGRYNSGLYGYDDAAPVAIAQNSHYREIAFDGFEDYGYGSSCDQGCATGRRFYLPGTEVRLDSTQWHTGRYSLRIRKQDGDSIGIKVPVSATDMALTNPSFNQGGNTCSPSPVLKSVRANTSVLLPSFSPLAGKKILLSAWVKESQDCKCTAYTGNQITLIVSGAGNTTVIAKPSGSIIDGWQRYEQVVDLPAGTDTLSLILQATGDATAYFDDIRIHPYNANMKSYVYDPKNMRLMAELDENNYATFYEYDDDGTLTRVKKETERGVKTIKETRNAFIKDDAANTGN
ncbi:hypothetical protein SAMN04488505_10333 [Chitinophaga rupis]|uniref:Uncharacterized protein n=1 Tax=Chitinophaga rupis TaxID=573321 RepID=A0A1H7UL56_9BACT|nr:hypothetical protein [Chitinophaga rupis]SEL97475.1 hypothetical protein SAMN04488505_10333 [Chitinophaga rupis]